MLVAFAQSIRSENIVHYDDLLYYRTPDEFCRNPLGFRMSTILSDNDKGSGKEKLKEMVKIYCNLNPIPQTASI